MTLPKLDRLPPPDWEHVEKYPLSAAATPPHGVPVVMGVNWYTDFDRPVQVDHRYVVCPDGKIHGSIRGGHCFAFKADFSDQLGWWRFYNQGNEGACVGFGCSRMLTDMRRMMFDAFWLYHQAQILGGLVGQEGAFVRDGLKTLMDQGPVKKNGTTPTGSLGISSYHWLQSSAEIIASLDLPIIQHYEAIPLLNSWGESYPHITWMPISVVDQLLAEDGEAAVVVLK